MPGRKSAPHVESTPGSPGDEGRPSLAGTRLSLSWWRLHRNRDTAEISSHRDVGVECVAFMFSVVDCTPAIQRNGQRRSSEGAS